MLVCLRASAASDGPSPLSRCTSSAGLIALAARPLLVALVGPHTRQHVLAGRASPRDAGVGFGRVVVACDVRGEDSVGRQADSGRGQGEGTSLDFALVLVELLRKNQTAALEAAVAARHPRLESIITSGVPPPPPRCR